jgi:hypothetical protein
MHELCGMQGGSALPSTWNYLEEPRRRTSEHKSNVDIRKAGRQVGSCPSVTKSSLTAKQVL